MPSFSGPQAKTNRSHVDDVAVQPLEHRVEFGRVYEVVISLTTANGGATSYGLFKTGANACIIEYRRVTTNGDEIVYQPFRGPTISSDGTDITSTIVNLNGNNQKSSTVTVFQGSTVTVDGAPIPRTYMPGSQNSGNRAVGSFREEGFVRHLLPNTDYAVKITNSGAKASATTDIHLVWYEYDNSDVTWR